MSVNGVTSVSADTYRSYKTQSAKTSSEAKSSASTEKAESSAAANGVVYEPSNETATTASKKTYKPNAELVAKLKAETEARTAQLQSLVEKMLTGQGKAYNDANDIWSILSSGKFTVDADTKAQAQADIAENGYWGVKQTSQRILDFANALTGGDPSKIDAMKAAFEKGYKQAEKTWGGQLPEISKQTYNAVLKGFDEMKAEAGLTE